MAEVIPIKGVLYNPEKADASSVMAPPYDVVTPDLKDILYEKSPYNIIRIDFGRDKDGDNEKENRYTRASGFLSDWLKKGILIHDREPSYYCYEISYKINGKSKKTRGFLGAVRIEELGSGRVHPHEMTYSKPKSDRLNILRYCSANTSPIFSLYSSTEKLASSILENTVKKPPFIESKNGDGFIHRLWRVSDSASINTIKKEMSDKDVFIADGHHRYETALAFKKEMEGRGLNKTGQESFNYVLMFLSNMEDDGLTLLPTHRIVEIDSDINAKELLGKYFEVRKISPEKLSGAQARQQMLEAMQSRIHAFGMYLTNADTYYLLSFNGSDLELDAAESLKNLDVTVLHNLIFERLLNVTHYEYEMDPDIAVERAKKGSFEAVFFLNSTRIHDVREVALAGHRMPPKSTYFYPKLLTGMVIYKF
ncbi:MAG TPA: DUF1015 domain-containing protein [Nitrospirae bacterium]|nr:hypothetical protein BMS3Bbin08_00461 [bacterium BMS3Bbin08]HDK17657.1 DUF1015 domain-containing protein [Nitrospirota bacterium]